MGEIQDRRQHLGTGGKRRRMIPGHTVTVGTRPDRPGWLFGVCECGEETEAQLPGVVEAWVTVHRWQVSRGLPGEREADA
ncbi:MAG TPA: hypothetical protein VE991_09145 [Acidimicrobiales bacterium]|nr:hypothetical protein [Acidimicrobiales bacterium]